MKSDNPFVQKFEKFAEEIKADESWRKVYMQTEVRMQDKFDAGMEAGMEKERLEIAKSLLRTNMSVDEIANHSGLSLDVLEKLKSEMP